MNMTTKEQWQDEIRLKMIEKSKFYKIPDIYGYGFYDAYQIQNRKIEAVIDIIQAARTAIMKDVVGVGNPDQLLQEAIILLMKPMLPEIAKP